MATAAALSASSEDKDFLRSSGRTCSARPETHMIFKGYEKKVFKGCCCILPAWYSALVTLLAKAFFLALSTASGTMSTPTTLLKNNIHAMWMAIKSLLVLC